MNTLTNNLIAKNTSGNIFKYFLWSSLIAFFISAPKAKAQITINWDRALGGSSYDLLQYQQQTSDGGYIMGGTSNSPAGGSKSAGSRGEEDYWVVKVDAFGRKQWDKTFGGKGKDFLQSMQQTRDGGYILAGYSNSPVSGDKSVVASLDFDYWIVKIDASGKKQWDKAFGGISGDFLVSVQQTSDKGYILGGTSDSPFSGRNGLNKTSFSRGEKDYWIVKLDASGNKEWDRTIGGRSYDYLQVVRQTKDKGFLLAGYSYSPSSGNKTGARKGLADYWVVKVNQRGIVKWNKTIGGSNEDLLQSMELTRDGGCILGGTSTSPASGNKSQGSRGESDYWLVKLDNDGTIQWDKTIGGSRKDELRSVKQTSDGGYIIGGYSTSPISGHKTELSNKDIDFWVVKVGSAGAVKWNKTIGGNKDDGLQSVQQVDNGDYILAGYSRSGATEDREAPSKGNYDFWMVSITQKKESEYNNKGNYYLQTFVSGNGSITRSIKKSSYISGSVVSLTAKPQAGYRFTGWTGNASGVQNPITITMNANKKIEANFAPVERDVYQAEEAGVHGGIRTDEHTGYTGEGYVDIVKADDGFIQWTIKGMENANYDIAFRYANGSKKAIPLKIMLNGVIIEQSKLFPATANWRTWSFTSLKAVLKKGTNVIRVKSFGKGGPNIDYIRVVTSVNGPGTMAQKVAENTLDSLIEIKPELQATGIKTYPNPFQSSTNITFKLAQDDTYELAVYDLNGLLVKSFGSGTAKANEEVQVNWSPESLLKGIYVIKLITKDGVQTSKVIYNPD